MDFSPAGLKYLLETDASAWGLHVAVHTADPGADGTNAEYSSNGIGRVPFGTPTITTDADSATAAPSATVSTDTATGATSQLTHVSFWSARGGGTFIGRKALTTARTLAADQRLDFAPTALTFDFPNA